MATRGKQKPIISTITTAKTEEELKQKQGNNTDIYIYSYQPVDQTQIHHSNYHNKHLQLATVEMMVLQN